jgi:hypothetical protein
MNHLATWNKLLPFFSICLLQCFLLSAQPSHIFHSADGPDADLPDIKIANDFGTNGGITGIEVGLKFQSSVSGYITGIRFYKGDGTTGTHIGHLWDPSSTSSPLASVTFVAETCYGWQEAIFSSPVSISANTIYIASMHSSSGDYAYTNPYFTADITNGSLTAIGTSSTGGPNGVYKYSSTSIFPNQNFQSTNYWIDVDFVTSNTDITPPTVSKTFPVNNNTDAATNKPIYIFFNENIDPATVTTSTIELRDPMNSLVTRTVDYNPMARMAIITPSSALTGSSVYTAKIKSGSSGVKDIAGNALAADYNWTFTASGRQHLLFDEGFEGLCPFGSFTTVEDAGHPWSRNQSAEQANEGMYSFRAEVRSYCDGYVSSGYRSEIQPNGVTDAGVMWYGMSIYFDTPVSGGGWTGNNSGHYLQWHPNNPTGSASLALYSASGQWDLTTNPSGGAGGTHHQIGTQTAGWHDFVFKVDWASSGGYVMLWIDGKLIYNITGLSWNSQGRYLKIGMNRWGACTTTCDPTNPGPCETWIVDYDNIRIGDQNACYYDVAPETTENDDAPGALPLIVNAGCSGAIYTNDCSTKSAGEATLSTCSGSVEAPVWFKFTAPVSGAVRISTDVGSSNSFADSKVSLFSASDVNDYSTFGIISCDDDGGSSLSSGNMSVVYATGLTGGQTYYIAVDKHASGTSTGTFCIAVDELASSMLATSNNCSSTYQTPTANSNTTYTGWQPLVDASSKLIALVRNPAGGAVDAYSVSQNINGSSVRADATSGQYYLDRNYRINNSASATNVDVQFFFLTSELTALHGVDAGVTLSNLGVTRQTGTTCYNDFTTANGTNSELQQTANGTSNDGNVKWIRVTTPGFSNFYLHTNKAAISVKAFLQGAYSSGLSRHKDVTSTWAAVLNANALSQPYNVSAFGNYAGTESVASSYFASNSGSTTDIIDWVLLELRDASTPSTIIARRAAFIREDGQIVDLDGSSDVSFRGVAPGNYFIAIRHRNHLGIRTASAQSVGGGLGTSGSTTYDFTTAQSQAYQNGTITTNGAMTDLGSGVYGLFGGNANTDAQARASGGNAAINDFLWLVNIALGGNTSLVLSNVYNNADMNMDGTVMVNSSPPLDDYLFLANIVLAGNIANIYKQHL